MRTSLGEGFAQKLGPIPDKKVSLWNSWAGFGRSDRNESATILLKADGTIQLTGDGPEVGPYGLVIRPDASFFAAAPLSISIDECGVRVRRNRRSHQ
jgi:hypothetical protein